MNKVVLISLFSMSMFFTGASGLVNEYVLSTVTTYILGNSIEQFSLTIALMLGFMGVGGAVQKFVNDKNLMLKFISLEISLSVIGGLTPLAIYAAYSYIPNHFALVQYFFIITIGFLIGFEIPFIIRINEKYTKSLKENLSFILAADYIGSLVGTLVWLYILLPRIPIYEISFIVSGVNLFVALVTYLYVRQINLKGVLLFVASVIVLTYGYLNAGKINKYIEQRLYKDPIVEEFNTKYQHLILTHNYKINDYRLYINGNTQLSSLDERRYHELLVHPAMSLVKNPKNILVIGGGDGMAIREIKKYESVENITLIDLDPGMIEFAKNSPVISKINEGAFEDINIMNPDWVKPGNLQRLNNKKSVNVLNIDADKMLWKLEGNYFDVVIVDLPDPSSIELSKLYSKEFFIKLRKVMTPNAVGSIQSTSPYHAKEAYLIIGNTVKAGGLTTLPYHANIPSFGEWGWWLFTKNGNIEKELDLSVETTFLTKEVFESSKIFGKGELEQKNKIVNTIMFPQLFEVYINSSWKNY